MFWNNRYSILTILLAVFALLPVASFASEYANDNQFIAAGGYWGGRGYYRGNDGYYARGYYGRGDRFYGRDWRGGNYYYTSPGYGYGYGYGPYYSSYGGYGYRGHGGYGGYGYGGLFCSSCGSWFGF